MVATDVAVTGTHKSSPFLSDCILAEPEAHVLCTLEILDLGN